MNYIYVLTEGETEEKFVKEILNPYFGDRNIFAQPIPLRGVSKYSIIKKELNTLLRYPNAKLVTTMIDLYGSPSDMPKKSELTQEMNYTQKVEILEEALLEDIDNNSKFIPYYQLHEFEALLFSDVNEFSLLKRNIIDFENIVRTKEPEEINDSPHTAPSKRIINIIPNYSKTVHGIILAKKIGLMKMREKCPHFNSWIEVIETKCNDI